MNEDIIELAEIKIILMEYKKSINVLDKKTVKLYSLYNDLNAKLNNIIENFKDEIGELNYKVESLNTKVLANG